MTSVASLKANAHLRVSAAAGYLHRLLAVLQCGVHVTRVLGDARQAQPAVGVGGELLQDGLQGGAEGSSSDLSRVGSSIWGSGAAVARPRLPPQASAKHRATPPHATPPPKPSPAPTRYASLAALVSPASSCSRATL
jgi:hypothetical protein